MMAYDPVKRHQYYMQTRVLKGRKKSSQPNIVTPVVSKQTSDPIGDTVKTIGNAASWVQNKTSETVKDARLTVDVMVLQSQANEIKKQMSQTNDPRKKISGAATLVKIMLEIEKKKREIAKSSV